jgi:uncharacterized protein
LKINEALFKLEIADTQEKREHGLAGRTLQQNEGMLFILEEPCRPYFWMKGCLEPLDIIWVDEEGKITEIEHNVPLYDEEKSIVYQPLAKVKYVVELKGGTAREAGLEIRQKLDI